ncbi:MAG TPA: endolytic transglycosylase MltG [Candidatus Saccharimonadales bacterium]|nr:endolytic transglycosylase MltG [Candidatus Saccharimonadales bacterium]
MRYTNHTPKKRWPRRVFLVLAVGAALVIGGTVAVRTVYNQNLKPLSSSQQVQTFTVKQGATVEEIGDLLEEKGLIRSAWAFKLYVSSKEVRNALQAGTYELTPSQSVAEIVTQLTHGKIVTNLVTILPGQRIDQIRKHLIQDGFSDDEVDDALNPANYADNPALVDKPAGASLEGYLYPDSYQRTSETSAKTIVTSALEQMNKRLTPDVRAAFSKQGLSTYQGIVMASMVEKEVSNQNDRDQVAQVFLKRIREGIRLQSDVTANYGAVLDGKTPSNRHQSPYNTYFIEGLPPTPISNVTASSLDAVAHPASTDWIYFVAGDDGSTHFSKTLAEHESNIDQYCKKLCSQ